jgi:hypothetical protein
MFKKGTRLTMIAGATALVSATAAMAGVLAPSKPSQSVVLRTNGVSTGCGGTSLDAVIDTQILSDGSTAPFTIPPGDVLVLDGIAWAASSGMAGRLIGILIDINGDLINAPWNDSAIADSLGDVGHDVFIPNIPIKSGVTPCLHSGGTITRGIVHGFLTRDH